MHNFQVSEKLQEMLKKISKKNNVLYDRLLKKIDEIANCYDVEHYKNLRYNMKDSKEAHVGQFVLVFRFNKQTDTIYFDDFDHHDKIFSR